MTDTTTSEAIAAGRFAWFRELGRPGRRAFAGAAGGWGLDAYDFQVLPLGLTALSASLAITTGQAGLLATVTLVVSAVGGILAGILADRIGRTRTLILTISVYAVCTVLCGFAPDYPTLLGLRALQGLGFGGEWAVGAVLVAEYAGGRYRGRVVAYVQSAWAIGWGLAVVVYTVVFSLVSQDLAWRVLFWTGAIPALLVLYLRRSVQDAPLADGSARPTHRAAGAERPDGTKGRVFDELAGIFAPGQLRVTLFAALLATGAQGGYYTLATWVPAYLEKSRHLSVVGTSGYLAFPIVGAFLGYVSAGHLADRIGRKWTFTIFAVMSGVILLAYTQMPTGTGDLAVMLLGIPLGFFSSGIFSGFGAFLAELYPTRLRGTGQGFTYNFGRGVGALFPAVVGGLAESVGVGGAMAFGALAYLVAVLALLGLPETRGRELTG